MIKWNKFRAIFQKLGIFYFLGIFYIFYEVFWIFKNFRNSKSNFLIKIDSSEFYKRAGDVARFGASDRVAIKGRGREAMWQPVERLISRGIKTVDPRLKRRVRRVI